MQVLVRLSLILLLLTGAAHAQSDYSGDDGYTPTQIRPGGGLPPVAGLSRNSPQYNDTGLRVVQALRDATAFCQAWRDPTYRIDCLSERLNYVAWHMPQSGPYAKSRSTLLDASAKLRAVAKKYQDTSRPPARQRTAGPRPQLSERPVVPVRRDLQAQADRAAAAVIAEAETVLLRSAAADPAVQVQVRNIAAAVGSNKVLLRSA